MPSIASQEHLDEIGGDDQLLLLGGHRPLLGRHGLEGRIRGLAAGNEPAIEDPLRDARHGKVLECPTHVSAGVAELQAPHEDDVEGGPRNDSELSGLRDGAREGPT